MNANETVCTKRLTSAFYCLIGLAALVLFMQPFSPAIQKIRLKQFHLRQDSFGTFALLHFIPPMYSFANEIWYTDRLADFDEITSQQTVAGKDTFHYWLNHYPLRFVSFSTFGRKMFFDASPPHYVYVRSKYQEEELTTVYELHREESRISLKAVEPERNS